MKSEIVVLGGGPGGYAAAFLAADRDMEVTLVEQDARLGGTCLLRGCIPSKALLHATEVMHEARHLADWGVRFGEPDVDVETMRARKDKAVNALSGGLGQLAKKRKVKVIQARATFESSGVLKLSDGDEGSYEDDRLTFEKLILASGSIPTIPPAMRVDSDRIIDSTGALDLPDIPEKLLVIGGGYIGLEMGTVYARLGSQVTVVEMTHGLLPGADRDLVRPLQKKLSELMEDILLETKVASLQPGDDAVEVELEGKAEGKRSFDRVLISVGRRPNSADLGLENTDVELDERGFVKVDTRQRTADGKILAIGDVAGEPMLAHKASAEAKVAVDTVAGEDAEFMPRAIPAVVFTDPELAWAGITQTQAEAEDVAVEVSTYPWAASGRAQALGRPEGLTKLLTDPKTQRVLGVGMVGTGCGELIAEAALAMEMGCTAEDLAETIHPHPTLNETITNAAEVLLGSAVEIYKPRRKS